MKKDMVDALGLRLEKGEVDALRLERGAIDVEEASRSSTALASALLADPTSLGEVAAAPRLA